MASGIYKITNKINGHCYIGSAVNINRRWRLHKSSLFLSKHHSVYLQRAWNKYGSDAFDFSIIENCSPFSLLQREQFWIDELNPEYNIAKKAGNTLGVRTLGHKHSDEARAKMAAAATGRVLTAETRAKKSAAMMGKNIGRKKTAEEVSKISAGLKGHLVSSETREKLRVAFSGKKASPDTIAKMSAAQQKTAEQKERLSLSMLAFWKKKKENL